MPLSNGGPPSLETIPSSLDFGDVGATLVVTRDLRIHNTSFSQTVHINGLSVDNLNFTVDNSAFPFTLAPDHVIHVNVTFTAPATFGLQTGTITIDSDAANAPNPTPVQGNSVASGTKAISIAPSSWIFPEERVGSTSPTQAFTVTNTGAGTVTVTVQVPVLDPNFVSSDLPGAPTALAAGASFTFHVAFKPLGGGYIIVPHGITITSDAPSSPDYVQLEGDAVLITPAYTVVGGKENGFVAFGKTVQQFDTTNFSVETDAYMERELGPAGIGYECEVSRVELQYTDIGTACIEVRDTNERDETRFQDVPVGVMPNGRLRQQLADIKLTGELHTIRFTVTQGPLSMHAWSPRFVPAGETTKVPNLVGCKPPGTGLFEQASTFGSMSQNDGSTTSGVHVLNQNILRFSAHVALEISDGVTPVAKIRSWQTSYPATNPVHLSDVSQFNTTTGFQESAIPSGLWDTLGCDETENPNWFYTLFSGGEDTHGGNNVATGYPDHAFQRQWSFQEFALGGKNESRIIVSPDAFPMVYPADAQHQPVDLNSLLDAWMQFTVPAPFLFLRAKANFFEASTSILEAFSATQVLGADSTGPPNAQLWPHYSAPYSVKSTTSWGRGVVFGTFHYAMKGNKIGVSYDEGVSWTGGVNGQTTTINAGDNWTDIDTSDSEECIVVGDGTTKVAMTSSGGLNWIPPHQAVPSGWNPQKPRLACRDLQVNPLSPFALPTDEHGESVVVIDQTPGASKVLYNRDYIGFDESSGIDAMPPWELITLPAPAGQPACILSSIAHNFHVAAGPLAPADGGGTGVLFDFFTIATNQGGYFVSWDGGKTWKFNLWSKSPLAP